MKKENKKMYDYTIVLNTKMSDDLLFGIVASIDKEAFYKQYVYDNLVKFKADFSKDIKVDVIFAGEEHEVHMEYNVKSNLSTNQIK